jgi:hypothetical protein
MRFTKNYLKVLKITKVTFIITYWNSVIDDALFLLLFLLPSSLFLFLLLCTVGVI